MSRGQRCLCSSHLRAYCQEGCVENLEDTENTHRITKIGKISQTPQVVFDCILPTFCDPKQHNGDVSPESYTHKILTANAYSKVPSAVRTSLGK